MIAHMRQPLSIQFLLLLVVAGNVYAADRPPAKSIRVVFGYENIGRWEQNLTEEIAQVLLEDKRVIFHTEYVHLDVEYTSSYDVYSTLQQARPNDADAIIAVRPQASSFLNPWRDTFSPGIPIVYLAPSSGMVKSDLGSEIDAIVPSAIKAAARDTLELLPKLLPDLEHIYILSGAGAADASYLNRIQSIIQEVGLQQTIHYLVGLTPSEMSAELNLAPKNTAAVFGLYSKDRTGRLFRPDDVVQLVSDQTDRPLFGLFEGYLDRGVVGGSMTSALLYGRKAAELTLAAMQEAQRIAHVGSWQMGLVSNYVTWAAELYDMQGLDPRVSPPDYTENSRLFTACIF